MVKCVVRGCPNRQDKEKNSGTSRKRFFSFPQDPGRVKVWLAALRETDLGPSDFNEICEDHFLADHITPQGISEDAIPLPPYLDAPVGACESSEGEQDVVSLDTDVEEEEEEEEDGELIEEGEEEDEDDDLVLIQQQNGSGVRNPQTSQERLGVRQEFVSDVPESEPSLAAPKGGGKSRREVSLGRLASLFMGLLSATPEGVLDIKEASIKLNTRKRRVYDITNVLAGIHLIQKKSASKIQWVGRAPVSSFRSEFQRKLKEEVQNLKTMEESLDGLIKTCAKQLFALTDDGENAQVAYVTYEDLAKVRVFQEQTLITVRAPEETKLDVPMPRVDGINMHLKGTRGPIHVLTCEMPLPGFLIDGNKEKMEEKEFMTLEESRIRTSPLTTDSLGSTGPVQIA